MWNLSVAAYGPRQKISTLLTYALPKAPKWLVVEFYAGNDVSDAIRDDVCQSEGDFRCRFNEPEVQWRIVHRPIYATMFEVPTDIWARLAYYSAENLTLATTQYLVDALKGRLKQQFTTLADDLSSRDGVAPLSLPRENSEAGAPAPVRDVAPAITQITIPPRLAMAGLFPAPVREGQWLAYGQAGLEATQQQYERLVAALAGSAHPAAIILLYNPAPYEVYRGIGMGLNRRTDQISTLQREVLSTFAKTHGWHFLDLTEPLREIVRDREIWLYGRYDLGHWSPQGTTIVANMLATELLKIMHNHQEVPQRPPTP
jgi:hypothetical protein